MTNSPMEDLFLIVYVLVDDWYQTKGKIAANPGQQQLLSRKLLSGSLKG